MPETWPLKACTSNQARTVRGKRQHVWMGKTKCQLCGKTVRQLFDKNATEVTRYKKKGADLPKKVSELTICLRCDKPFDSPDKKAIRFCPKCRYGTKDDLPVQWQGF